MNIDVLKTKFDNLLIEYDLGGGEGKYEYFLRLFDRLYDVLLDENPRFDVELFMLDVLQDTAHRLTLMKNYV